MRTYYYSALAVILAGLFFSCTSSREAEPVKPGKVLVIVNGESIKNEDVERRKRALFGVVDISQADPIMVARMMEQAVEAEIMDLLLLQAAREAGIADRLLVRTFREQLFEDVTVDDTVLEEYFEGHRDRFQNPDGVRLHIMVVEDEKTADALYEKMVAGEVFETTADSYGESGGKVSKTRWMPYDVLPDGIRPLVLANAPGEIIRHREESGKVYLIKILEKRDAALMEFDEAREMVKSALLQSKRQRVLDNWYEKQIKTATIEYFN
jgi:hypothetical protein